MEDCQVAHELMECCGYPVTYDWMPDGTVQARTQEATGVGDTPEEAHADLLEKLSN